MKAYTNLEQSKKLAEFLPFESADMQWIIDGLGEPFPFPVDDKVNEHEEPCWSLTALLDVLPHGTRLLKSVTDDAYHCDCPKENIDKWFDNPIDAAFEIIVKLHEQKLKNI